MPDDWGHITRYKLDTYITIKCFNFIKTEEFDLQKIKDILDLYLGINAFDLYILKMFIEKYNIKKILELGCGSSSLFLDQLQVERETYSLSSQEYDIKYIQCNILNEWERIEAAAKTADLIFIDAEHSKTFATEYYKRLLLQTNAAIFIHDWFLPGETTYSEQISLLNLGILDKYKFQIITRMLCKELYDNSNTPPCSILLRKEQ